MGQAKQRTAEIMALKANGAKAKSNASGIDVYTLGGVQSFSSMDEYFNQVDDSLSRFCTKLV
jgi:hypothetical protein